MMKYPLCEYAIDKSTSIRVNVKCSLTGKPCGMVRWCSIRRCVKMNDLYNKFDCREKRNISKIREEEKNNGKNLS